MTEPPVTPDDGESFKIWESPIFHRRPPVVQHLSDIEGPASDKSDLGRDVMEALRRKEPIFYAAPRSPEELQQLIDLGLSAADIELIRSLPPHTFAVRMSSLSPLERVDSRELDSNSSMTVVVTHRLRSDEPLRLDGTVNPFDTRFPPNTP